MKSVHRGDTPTPTLSRRRERGRSEFAGSIDAHHAYYPPQPPTVTLTSLAAL